MGTELSSRDDADTLPNLSPTKTYLLWRNSFPTGSVKKSTFLPVWCWNPNLTWHPVFPQTRKSLTQASSRPSYNLSPPFRNLAPGPIHTNRHAHLHITKGKEDHATECFTQNIDSIEHAVGVPLERPTAGYRSPSLVPEANVH
ncbi:hypothetical protein HOY80DRAFT_1003248 [Tuber brumale]|nr:hypothetical protein HOY80DRAFT_1003248 [Tuber brumale]